MKFLPFLILLTLLSCDNNNLEPNGKLDDNSKKEAPKTNRIDLPSMAQKNLGIKYIKAEKRAVSETLRLPGYFELLPSASQDYRMLLSGMVEVLVSPFQKVKENQALFRIHSKTWYEFQEDIFKSKVDIEISKQRKEERQQFVKLIGKKKDSLQLKLKAIKKHVASLEKNERIWSERLKRLQEISQVGGGQATEITECRGQLASIHTSLAKTAEEEAELQVQGIQYEMDIQQTLNEIPRLEAEIKNNEIKREAILKQLTFYRRYLPKTDENSIEENKGFSEWQPYLEICAQRAGLICNIEVSNGSWVEENKNVLKIVSGDKLGFRATALQSNLRFLKESVSASIVPSQESGFSLQEQIPVKFEMDPRGNLQQGILEVFAKPETPAKWAYAGVGAFLELVLETSGSEDIAIPSSCIIQDGLQAIFFRRNEKNPNQVIRVEADIGISDGRWVTICSDLKEGDEVVIEGVYALKLATSKNISKGGHYHPDGTWHDKEH